MKIPFSYRQNFFHSVLIASCIGHGVLFAQADFFSTAPEYSVVQAPASLEVVMIMEELKPKPELRQKVLTGRENVVVAPKVLQVEEHLEKKEEIKPIAATSKGALSESKPEYLQNPAPVYPYRARQRGWEGVTILRVLVDQSGNPEEVVLKRSSGYRILDAAALEAVRKWKFKSAKLGAISLRAWTEIPVRFVLEE